MKRLLLITLLLLSSVVGLNSQSRGTPSTLVVKVDANGFLLVTSATQTNPITQGTLSTRNLRTDASGSLQVVLTGTVTPTYPLTIPASTCAASSLGLSGGATTGIAFTATPSILDCISGTARTTLTASTFTSTVPILGPDGSLANVGVGFASDVDTGLLSGGDGILIFGTNNANRLQLASNGAIFTIGNVINRGTITTDVQVQNDTVTWNNAGVTFEGWQLTVTDTASAAGSRVLNILGGAAGTTALFNVDKAGAGSFAAAVSAGDFSTAGRYILNSKVTISSTAPTIGSGFGTSPSIVASNGTAAFTINVGTGGTASSGVVTMPAATTGWNCSVENRTGVLANVANQRTIQIATTTTSVTLENQTISTGAVLAWTASDVLAVMCAGY